MSASLLLPAATRGSAAMPGDVSPPLRRLGRLLSSLSPAANGSGTVGRLGNLRLSSHFQPIYSLSHMRVVGHEALLRARDPQDRFVSPPEVFAACDTLPALAWCDSLSRIVHLANFTAALPGPEWLFLNVNPEVFQRLAKDNGDAYMHGICEQFGITGDRMVIEVLENALTDTAAFEESLGIVRSHGCLIAIDDFGAGHSNFDRVWRIQPDIVKLDRSLVTRAARDRRAQRVVSQMVSLLHECGTMVLMEGVETLDEALLALESDADMVQGYFFGRPQPGLVASGHVPDALTELYSGLGQRRDAQRKSHREQLAPYRNAIGNAGVMLSAGRSMEEACHAFLQLTGAELCYLLDVHGFQIGSTVYASVPKLAYAPLRDSAGACWARRPYFRRAMDSIGRVQVTRPYRTLHGNHSCVTASMAFQVTIDGRQELRVIGGDLTWNDGPVASDAAQT